MTMSKKGSFTYRCRRCGEHFQFATFSHLPASAKAMCLTQSARDQLGREQFSMRPHTCPDGQVGICDIIGGEYAETPAPRSSSHLSAKPSESEVNTEKSDNSSKKLD